MAPGSSEMVSTVLIGGQVVLALLDIVAQSMKQQNLSKDEALKAMAEAFDRVERQRAEYLPPAPTLPGNS
jgi:hypothetical protein